MVAVRYLVSNVPQAVEFYSKHLGFEVLEEWGEAFAMLQKDDLKLWLSGPQSSAGRPMEDGTKPSPGGWNRFVIQVENIDDKVKAMSEAGVTFRNKVVKGPGGSQVLACDPDGNVVELFEPA